MGVFLKFISLNPFLLFNKIVRGIKENIKVIEF